jgi:hypothetical protein
MSILYSVVYYSPNISLSALAALLGGESVGHGTSCQLASTRHSDPLAQPDCNSASSGDCRAEQSVGRRFLGIVLDGGVEVLELVIAEFF